MKKIIVILALYLCTMSSFAGEVKSLRTQNGDIIRIGDSESLLLKKMGNVHGRDYLLRIDGRTHTATDYSFQIENVIYIVTIVNGIIHRIDWSYR